MKRILCLLGVLVVIPLSNAGAEPYAGLSGGISLVNSSTVYSSGTLSSYTYSSGPNVSIAGGYRIDRHRFELEYSYRKTPVTTVTTDVPVTPATTPPTTVKTTVSVNDADLTVSSYMANYYLNVYDTPIAPFVGMGLGVVSVELSTPTNNVSGVTLGMQFSGGATYHLHKNIDLDFMYRYQFVNANIKSNAASMPYGSSNFTGGARYYF